MLFNDVLLVVIPSIVVFLTAYFVLKTYLNSIYKTKLVEIKDASKKDIVMMRLQAYERMILLLERISPNSLIARSNINQGDISAMHQQLLVNIRAEFDHNIAQQLYISSAAWQHVVASKEIIVKVINVTKEQSQVNDTVAMFSKHVLSNYVSEMKVVDSAIEFLKKEAQGLF